MKICKVLCPEAYLVLKISLSEHYFTLKIIYYFYIFFKIFIYFWLYWILVAAHRLSLAVVHGRFLVAASIVGGEGNGTPLQYSCLGNPMDRGGWWAAVHGVAKSRTRLSDFTFTFHFHTLEKEMATHSSTLAWRIPGTGEPGGLPSMWSHRVGHD